MNSICKSILVSIFLISMSSLYSQNYWQEIDVSSINIKTKPNLTLPKEYASFKLDIKEFRKKLNAIPLKGSSNISNGHIIYLPTSYGSLSPYKVIETPVFDEELSKKYPNIKSYTGQGVENPSEIVRFSMSHLGFKSMLISAENGNQYTEPYSNDEDYYLVYQRKDKLPESAHFECKLTEVAMGKINSSNTKNNANDGILRTYRLAVSTTGEYTEYFGGTVVDALAAINATMTNVNGIFETELNVTFELIVESENVIYTDPTTDPYDPYGFCFFCPWNEQVQTTLTNEIGEANYDLGHLFMVGDDSGNAGFLSSVCVDEQKGSAWSASINPDGSDFEGLVSHEMGHQFGANHTWTVYNDEGFDAHVEPGSGSTIMSYAGITYNQNVQENRDLYFHAFSIQQMSDFVNSTSCQEEEDTGNSAPTVDAGSDYNIPMGTAFVLTGTASDSDGDELTYCWEQMDEDDAVTEYPSVDATEGVAFRSFSPTSSNFRTFPELTTILNGETASTWEAVPNMERDLNFRLTVRDNVAGGGTNDSDDMVVSVDAGTGPFKLTVPSTDVNWAQGTAKTIKWDVAGTDAGPINVDMVNIYQSIDGGTTFTIIAENTPNDGEYDYIVPNNLGISNRIKIEAVGNIFFDISDSDFNIVELIACDASVPNNLNAVNVQDYFAAFVWDDVVGSGSFDFRYRETGTITWTTISVNTNSTNLTDISPQTDYEAQVRTVCLDNSTSAFSESINFSTIDPYCSPIHLYADGTPLTNYFSQVSIGSIDNSSGGSENGYDDFVYLTTDLVKGSEVTININPVWPGEPSTRGIGVYLDFNGDSDFDDTGEEVLSFVECGVQTPLSGTFYIPTDAVTGNTRLRIVLDIYANTDPCDQQYYAETEDYTINLVPNCNEEDSNDGESGWGIWNDGGIDAFLVDNADLANSGSHSFVIRDNTDASVITSNNIDLSGAAEAIIDFNFIGIQFTDPSEDFWLQVSTDGGITFTTVEEWNYEDEFLNYDRVFESVNIPGPFTETTQFRFRCDASTNSNLIYYDDVVIDACNAVLPTCNDGIQNGGETNIDCGGPDCNSCEDCNVFDFNDVETDWGIWNGGENAALIDDPAYANSGTFSFRILDSSYFESWIATNNIDLSNENSVKIDFNCITTNSPPFNQTFSLQVSLDGGNSFQTAKFWSKNIDFIDDTRIFTSYTIQHQFTETTQFRFVSGLFGTNAAIYIDDISIEICDPLYITCSDGIQNGDETDIDCGGTSCVSCLFCDVIDFNDAETDTGIWNGINNNPLFYSNFNNAWSGFNSFRLASFLNAISTDDLDMANIETAVVEFTHIGEFNYCDSGFSLEVSLDGGNSFTQVEDWHYEDDFTNLQRYFESISIPGPFTETTQFRFISDMSGYLYIDNISIKGCSTINPLCEDGIQNGDETGVDCGGSECPACLFCDVTDSNDGESGWGIWNDGGNDAFLVDNEALANSGTYSFVIRDNTDASVITSNDMDLSGAVEAVVDFNFIGIQFTDPSEDFWLQVSTDGGATFTTVEEWNFEDEFTNYSRVFESVTIPGPFSTTTQFRFRCDASNNSNLIYYDDVIIQACDETAPSCDDGFQNGDETGIDCGGSECPDCPECNITDSNDIETSWGIWNDGGADATRVNNSNFANSGNYSLLIKDNTSTSVITTDEIDLSNYVELNLDFSFIATGFNNTTQDFWLQISTDGGASFTMIQDWIYTIDFSNNLRVFENVNIAGPFTAETKIRFRCDASGNNDKIYIDDIVMEACDGLISATCDDGIQNGDETGVDCGGIDCPSCEPCTIVDSNDIETDWGIWIDGGADAARVNDATYSSSGTHSLMIKDNTTTSNITTAAYNFSGVDEVNVAFNFITTGFNSSSQDFWLQLSTDGGVTFTTIKDWSYTIDFDNNIRVFENVNIVGPFTTETLLRFQCDATGNNDKVYFDDIEIETCSYTSGAQTEMASSRISVIDNSSSSIKLYPNPVLDKLNVDIEENEFKAISIFSLTGQSVYEDVLGTTNVSIDVSNLIAGVYIVRFVDANGNVEARKFIKQRN